jgi:hypothetical protein
MRTDAEKRFVRGQKKTDYGDIPLGEKSLATDLWPIARAAECLNRYKRSGNKEIQRYDTVIAKLFYAAFGETRSDESIRKDLNRQSGKTSRRYVLSPILSR